MFRTKKWREKDQPSTDSFTTSHNSTVFTISTTSLSLDTSPSSTASPS